MTRRLGQEVRRIAPLLLLATMLPCSGVAEEGASPLGDGIDAILREMKSEAWQTRSSALYRLLGLGGGDISYVPEPLHNLLRKVPHQADQIKVALIQLLEKENLKVESHAKAGTHFGEDYSNYYGDVISAVSSLNDIRSMNAMLGAMTTGGMAERALASFAPVSIGPVIEKLHDRNLEVRLAALYVLIEMVKPEYSLKVQPYRSKIKGIFLRAVKDPNPNVRDDGVIGLGILGDVDVIPILEDMAKHDPAFLPGEGEGGTNLYFVRHGARLALAQLKGKAPKKK